MKHFKNVKLIVSIIVAGAAIIASGTAFASWGNPSPSTGYFNNGYDPGSDYGHVIQNGLFPITGNGGVYSTKSYKIPTKTEFVNYILGVLGNQTQYAGATQDQIGAAFIIQTMRPSPSGVTSRAWPSTSDIQNWTDSIIKNSDIVLDIKLNFSVPDGHNSGYSNSKYDDAWIVTNATTDVLVFKSSLTGTSYYMLKINCANAVGDMPGMPLPPPIIKGLKVDTNGDPNGGPYKDDTISATVGIPTNPASDANNPFSLTVRAGTTTVTAANAIPGWQVVGYYTFTCTSGSTSCSNQPQYVAVNSSPPYNYTFTTKDGYVYSIKWVYKAVVSPVITGYKVDTSNGTNGAFSGDIIRANSASSSGNPFTFKVSLGKVTVTADDNVKGWRVTGSTYCDRDPNDPSTASCGSILPTASSPSFQPGTSRDILTVDGHTYYMRWVYQVDTSPPSQPGCPSLPNPLVTVALPDNTPQPRTAPQPATSPNSWYTQYTPQGRTNVTSVNDISAGGNRVMSIANLKSQSYQQAVIDYTPYIANYPYDKNQPSVTYDTYYTETLWLSASTPSYYTCNPGDTRSGTVCTHMVAYTGSYSYTTSNYTSVGTPSPTLTYSTCPAGSSRTGDPSQCIVATPQTVTTPYSYYTYTYKSVRTCTYNRWTRRTTCSYQTVITPVLHTGYTSYTYNVYTFVPAITQAFITYTNNYICNPGDTGGSASSTCVHTYVYYLPYTYPATAWYNYTAQTPSNRTNSNTVSGIPMGECYSRRFIVTAVNSASANVSLNNSENPTTATAGGYTALVQFLYPANGPQNVSLRQPMKANLTYSYNFSYNSSTICTGGNSFVATGGFGPSGPSPYPITGASCGVSVPPLLPGSTVCAVYTLSPTGGTIDSSGTTLTTTGGTVPSGPQCSGPVVNEPYFKVFGGDISVGNTFATTTAAGATTCTSNSSNSSSGIHGWNTANSGIYAQRYAGAGAQFAVTALSTLINGVASNQYNPNATPAPSSLSDPIGLAFSNSNAAATAPSGIFGGNFGSASCMPDYYASQPPGTTLLGSTTAVPSASGTYSLTDGSTITSGNILASQHVVIYAAGNVYINGDINFAGGSYATIDQVPSFVLIAKGNIYISSSVRTLSGIFIAQPRDPAVGTDGIIYDCATGIGAPVSSGSLYGGCGTQLTVNGSFLANKVVLTRTGNANNDKLSSSLRGSFSTETNTNNNAAEIFNYGPAFWMNIGLPQLTPKSAGYDSIISLPPIL